MQLGQHAEPSHVVAHLSDPHLLAGGARLHGVLDTTANLRRELEQLEASGIGPDAIVFTGDLADLGEPEAYARLRAEVEPVADRLGAALVWVMGNHDERAPYAKHLFDEESDGLRPQDRIYDVRGLRIISLDTTVPGYHHGALEPEQLDWLRAELAIPAEHGTLVAVHHPPIPSPLTEAMSILELEDQGGLADVLRGTDVRAILGGHLHYSTHSLLAGIPVSVASASCYTLALGRTEAMLGGVDAFQAFSAVHVYADRIVHTTVPLGAPPLVSGHPAEAAERLAAIPPAARPELFSRKDAGPDAAAALAGDSGALERVIAAAEAGRGA